MRAPRQAMERFGAKFEGIHRSHMVRPDGKLRDTAWFSVIREEWPGVRDGLDARGWRHWGAAQ